MQGRQLAAALCVAATTAACGNGGADSADAKAAATDGADATATPTDAQAGTVPDALKDTAAPLADGATGPVDGGAELADAVTAIVCPGPAKPAADASWGDVAVPDTAGCAKEDPQFFKGTAPPPQSLAIEVGVVNPGGVFVPYQDGDWVPLVHGSQGGFHVWAGLRFKLPGSAVPKAKLQTDMVVRAGCAQVAYGNNPVIYPELQGDGSYVLGNAATPGLEMRFSADETGSEVNSAIVGKFCNRWYELRVAARDMATQKWGTASVRVRAYDTSVGMKK